MGKGTITAKVLELIESRLKAAEQFYKEECERIDGEAFQKKADAADKIVASIVK